VAMRIQTSTRRRARPKRCGHSDGPGEIIGRAVRLRCRLVCGVERLAGLNRWPGRRPAPLSVRPRLAAFVGARA
jgi:hypothetical protein